VAIQRLRRASKRTLLVVGGGTEAIAGIERAHEMGLHVVVSDGSPSATGLLAADDRLLASTYDVDATVAAARGYRREVGRIDGVICIASDVPLTVASVACELGLPGITLDAARLTSDKLAMKQTLVEHGVNVPWFAPAATATDLCAHVAEQGYPLVVKPVDSRGARGVLLLRDERTDLGWAHETALRESRSGRVMVERFIDGPQISSESLIVDGVAHTIGLADRNYEFLDRFAPHVIENGGEMPSRLAQDARAAVCDVIQRSVSAFGVSAGVIKGDIVMHAGSPYVIEVALRLSGGYLCTYEIPLSTGVDLVGEAIRIALGETPSEEDLQPRSDVGVAQRWMFPPPGRVCRVTGAAAVMSLPEIAMCEVRVVAGDVIAPVSSHPSRSGVVIATGPTRETAIDHVRSALAAIEIEVEPITRRRQR
jgi:biotin carboxylase